MEGPDQLYRVQLHGLLWAYTGHKSQSVGLCMIRLKSFFLSTGPEHFDEVALNGKFCVVLYDGKPYPGIVQDIDDTEIEVNVMHNIGPNRFFWPRMQDVLWYSLDKFVTLIPPPTKVGSRHHQIQPQLWESIKELLDI